MIIRIRWAAVFVAAIVVPLLNGCVGTSVAPGPELRKILAPTGKLRVGVYPGSPISMIQDPASGETKGVTFDLGKELAHRLGVPFDAVVFPRLLDVVQALRANEVDFIVTNATPDRAKDIDFTPPLLQTEQGYLVLTSSRVSKLADVDGPGIRVGVLQGSTSHRTLSSQLKNAAIVSAPTLKSAIEMLSQRKVDVFATNKAILFELSDNLPGSRVLDGRYGLEQFAMGIPKGRDQGMPYVRKFAEDAKSEGLVGRAVKRAGLRGTVKTESH
jgi:polar amino acid transport system substrate-binding protein